MTKLIVAMSGKLPQATREENGMGLVALVCLCQDENYDGKPEHLMERYEDRIRKFGNISQVEWHKWFDKTHVFDDSRLPRSSWNIPEEGKEEARKLVSVLSTRPRLVLLDAATATGFGVWSTSQCYYRWEWADWVGIHDVELQDNRAQLISVVPYPTAVEGKEQMKAVTFWEGLARACRNGRARTN